MALVTVLVAVVMFPAVAVAHGLSSAQRAAYRQLRSIEAHEAQILEGSFREQNMATSAVRHDCRVLLGAHLGADADAALRFIASVPIRVSNHGDKTTARRLARALKTLATAVHRAG